jgi:hypothetical protein
LYVQARTSLSLSYLDLDVARGFDVLFEKYTRVGEKSSSTAGDRLECCLDVFRPATDLETHTATTACRLVHQQNTDISRIKREDFKKRRAEP